MNWTDILAALSPGAPDGAERPDSLALEGTPPIRVYRRNCRPNSYATPHGNGAYDPYGGVLLAATDPYPDAIYADSPFLTCVSCGVALPEARTLTMKPAPLAGLKQLFKKPAQERVRWSVKTDLPEGVQTQLLAVLGGQNQVCLKHVAIQLTPVRPEQAGECNHRLTITTKLLPDELTNFCRVKEFDPLASEGKRATDLEAACLLVETMIGCCRALYAVLTGTEGDSTEERKCF